jgi:hypothetical protein
MLLLSILALAAIQQLSVIQLAEASPKFHETLMRSTHQIIGQGPRPGLVTTGTAILFAKTLHDDPGRFYYLCVTAAHVFSEMRGDSAYLKLHALQSDGSYMELLAPIRIREQGRPRWYSHPDSLVDVAALYVAVPTAATLEPVSTGWLATETELKRLEIAPGDEVFTLGFPHGATSGAGGFPILRTGRLSSYPLLPTTQIRSYLLDTPVYPGNSGGPAYMCQTGRQYGDTLLMDEPVDCIIGVVSERTVLARTNETLELATIVPSPLVHELISRMPKAPTP